MTKIDDLQDNLWAITATDGAKCHYCPKQLVNDLILELESRYGETGIVTGTDEGLVDLRGMVMIDRPLEKIKIDTFTLTIPSQDFDYFLQEMEEIEERNFASGRKYYKIHGWRHCVVFTPEQYFLVLGAMREMVDQVAVRAEAADREFSRRLAEANKASEARGGAMILSARDKYSEYSPILELVAPKKDNN